MSIVKATKTKKRAYQEVIIKKVVNSIKLFKISSNMFLFNAFNASLLIKNAFLWRSTLLIGVLFLFSITNLFKIWYIRLVSMTTQLCAFSIIENAMFLTQQNSRLQVF